VQVESAEMRARVAKLGLAAVLAYGLFDAVTYTTFFVLAFLGYEKSTGKNPAANIKALLGVRLCLSYTVVDCSCTHLCLSVRYCSVKCEMELLFMFIFRENAKALRFDALIEKKFIGTSPRDDKHLALQLGPRKRTYPRGGVGEHPGPPRPPIAAYFCSLQFFF
jgi:hypothetical protein